MYHKGLLKFVVAFGLVAILLASLGMAFVPRSSALSPAKANSGIDLSQIQKVTDAYVNSVPAALADGYHLVTKLDYCYDNPGVGGMGHHYLNTSLIDAVVDPLKPEALVYDFNSSGELQLAAVEYIVPIKEWDSAHSQPPALFGQTYKRNSADGDYSLHAWVWQQNPSGTFSEWNPKISQCRLAPPPQLDPNEGPS